MVPHGVQGVTDEILDTKFPVGIDVGLDGAGQKLDTAFFVIEQHIQIPAVVPEPGFQVGGFAIKISEYQSFVVLYPGLAQSPLGFVDGTFVNMLVVDAHQGAVHTKRPAVVVTSKAFGVAAIGKTDLVAAMGTGVQKYANFVQLTAHADHPIFTHVGGDKVAAVGDL